MNKERRRISRIKGCLFGGAFGDSLGYPVEFLSLDEIKTKYGRGGINYFSFSNSKALISDDTQMTLFTASGVVSKYAKAYFLKEDKPINYYVYYSYLDWLKTQGFDKKTKDPNRKDSWLVDVPELNHQRFPGRSVISSLTKFDEDHKYNFDNPINDSKGCGALIRIAPLGLIDASVDVDFGLEASYIASFTHGHPLSYLSCQYYALIIHNIMKDDGRTLWRIAKDALRDVKHHYDLPPNEERKSFFNKLVPYVPEFVEKMKKVLILVKYDMVKEDKTARDNAPEIIKSLGEGWVAEETLAIALYCAVRYQTEPEIAIRKAVNHDGDSDSTGPLTGQLLGTFYGDSIFPPYCFEKLELVDVIDEIASDLAVCTHLDNLSSKEKNVFKTKYIDNVRYQR